MREIGIISFIFIIVNGLVTYKGLKDFLFFNKFLFNVDKILVNKEYKRLVTSGFLHVDWTHFIFNMITLYLFGENLEFSIGILAFLALYFGSLIGGNLFALYINKNHSDYSAVGASSAVSGLVFASIGLFPDMKIGFLLLPIDIPAWLFGLIYVLYSIYGIKSKKDNIGHEAHLGGGVIGLLIAISINPSIIHTNYFSIILILLPSLLFLFLTIKKPHFLLVDNPFSKSKRNYTIEDKYNSKKVENQIELDKILDKINKKGYDNLTKKEKERLSELSK